MGGLGIDMGSQDHPMMGVDSDPKDGKLEYKLKDTTSNPNINDYVAPDRNNRPISDSDNREDMF